jgi:flavodoxin I
MSKISVIYWSGTGNTKMMAEALTEELQKSGSEVKLLSVDQASKEDVLWADAVALGCPSMGCEVLEEDEMEPFVAEIEKDSVKGKPMALFGSFDWGDGQWMREWYERMEQAGAKLVEEGLTIQNTPEDADLEKCRELGRKLANFQG